MNYLNATPSIIKVKNYSEIKLLFSPWYHNFAEFGVRTPFPADKTYKEYQGLKGAILDKYIEEAMQNIRKSKSSKIKIVEYFAADCYHGIFALRVDQNSTLQAIDKLGDSGEGMKRNINFEKAKFISRVLKLSDRIEYLVGDVFDYRGECDLLLNIGGLYHIEDPLKLVLEMRKLSPEYAVFQSVVHENREMADFMISPAPFWNWGSRFTYNYLRNAILESGYTIIGEDFNLLYLNDRIEDRGSAYFLAQRNA